MAVITLSWQYGCLGDLVAEDVANQLGYTVLGKKEINEMLINSKGQSSKEVQTNNSSSLKTAEEEIEPRFFQRLYREHGAYANLLSSHICKAASQDKVVIKGYGGHMVLAHQPHVLNVRLKGRFEARVTMLQKHKQLDQHTARKLVKKEDQERVEFVQYVFKQELTDVQSYDMILDVEKVGLTTITGMIVSAARSLEETHPITEAEKDSLDLLAFEYQIKSIIQQEVPTIKKLEVSISPNAIVTVSGNVAKEDEKTQIEQRVRSLPEVQDLVNHLKISVPFRIRA